MIAQEIMGSVDQNGQLCLDTPLMAHKHSRVKVIVLFIDDEIEENDSGLSYLETSLKNTPVSQLGEAVDQDYEKVTQAQGILKHKKAAMLAHLDTLRQEWDE